MRPLMFAALTLIFVPWSEAGDPKPKKNMAENVTKELKRLEGTWEMVSSVVDGKTVTPPEAERGKVVFQADGSFTAEVGGKVVRAGTMVVDPDKTPKAVDIIIKAGTLKGKATHAIYALEGDELRMALPGPGRPRPTAFSTEGDPYLVIQNYRRVKDKQK
jgi:uncharacterized protein (TIGR03067 family)